MKSGTRIPYCISLKWQFSLEHFALPFSQSSSTGHELFSSLPGPSLTGKKTQLIALIQIVSNDNSSKLNVLRKDTCKEAIKLH